MGVLRRGCHTATRNEKNIATSTDDVLTEVGIEKSDVVALLQSYSDMDETVAAEIRQYYIEMQKDEELLKWYDDNRKHVDSVMNCATELITNNRYKEAFVLLNNEKMNIYAHPNSNSYTLFDLHKIMGVLGMKYLEEEEYLPILIENWELTLMQIDAVQYGKNEYHPYYPYTLKFLHLYYEQADSKEKMAEIESG